MKLKKNLQGQALIIGLLFVVIISTLVLALMSRSLKDVKISTESQKELRTFSAAEAGLEKVLNNPTFYIGSGQNINVGNVAVKVATQKAQWGKTVAFTFPDGMAQDEVRQFFLSQYDESTHWLDESNYYSADALDILWGSVKKSGGGYVIAPNQPGVEVTLYYHDPSDSNNPIKIKRFAYDSQGRGNFSTSGVTEIPNQEYQTIFGPKHFAYRKTLNFDLASHGYIPLFLRIRFLFNGNTNHPLGFAVPSSKTGNYYYPTQGYKITSQAQGDNDNSGAIQRIEAFKSFPLLPSFFDYAVFSGNSLEVSQ